MAMSQSSHASPKSKVRARLWWGVAVMLFAIAWGVVIWPHLMTAREVSRIRSAIYAQCVKYEAAEESDKDGWWSIRGGLSPTDKPDHVLEALWDLAVVQKAPRTEQQSLCNNLCAQSLHQVAFHQAIPPETSNFRKAEWFSAFDAILAERAGRRHHLKEHERTLLEKLEEFRSISPP
ncbi:MAG: hypothetical protein ACAH88_07045 [Roseimicrobium sp.]